MQQELAAKQQQLDLLNANAQDLQEELRAVKAAQTSVSDPLGELLLQKMTDMHQNVSEVKAAVCSGRVAQSSIASDRLMSIPVGTVVDNDESASDVQSPDGCKHCIAADFVKAMDHKTANAVLDDGPKDTNQVHGLDMVDGHTVEGPVVGTLTSIACGDEPSVLNPLCVDDFMYPPSKETVASQFLYSCGRRLVNVTHEAMHDSQNLSENSICSTDEEVGTATRQGARNGISNNNSSIASTAEQTSIATNIASCDVLDKIATVILDTHDESSPKVADHDLTHASPSTTVPATLVMYSDASMLSSGQQVLTMDSMLASRMMTSAMGTYA